jgi:diguanylate cyclase
VNDSYGHLAGDRVLRAVAKLLDEQKRVSDFLARYGGEEFALILPETPADHAKVLAEKARTMVAGTKFRYEEELIQITISAGVGEVAAHKESAEDLFARVDAALYRAKEKGRNRVELAEVG